MHKHPILIMGAGKIGITVATLLNHSEDYQVTICDQKPPTNLPEINTNPILFFKADINTPEEIIAFIKANHIEAIVSCLPFYLTLKVAQLAHTCNIHYFDPTEDVNITQQVISLAQSSTASFAPQCGLAPGFISIVSNAIMQEMDQIVSVKMRVGALPQSTNNSLRYAFTWSIDGLINEYIHPCTVIEDGIEKTRPALGGLESLTLNGEVFEAFHTSGGIGSLTSTYAGKVKYLDYKTLRYPGHCDKMSFLLNDLKLREQPKKLIEIMQASIPHVSVDKVIIYVAVQGFINEQLVEKSYLNTSYPCEYLGQQFSAIQMTTASAICMVIDSVLVDKKYSGFIKQENITLSDFLNNRFGAYYKKGGH